MKKLLALVLALVMTLGLATVSSNAAFADAEKIDHTQAVEVMNSLNIISGKENNNFDPDGNVKRSEMAKMVAIALLGDLDPAAFAGAATDLTDISGHWAEGYIKFCVAQGIVGGRGNGTFDPDANVTTAEAAKMLLVALGYNSTVRGYTGESWTLAVMRDAQQKGLLDKLTKAGTNIAMDRDDAAQLIYNTLNATRVEETQSINSDGTITLQYKDATAYPDTLLEKTFGSASVDDTLIGTTLVTTGANKGTYNLTGITNNYIKSAKDYSDLLGQRVTVIFEDKDKDGIFDAGEPVTGVYAKYENAATELMAQSAFEKVGDKEVKANGTSYKFDNATPVLYTVAIDSGVATTVGNTTTAAIATAGSTDLIRFVDWDQTGKYDLVLVYTVTNEKLTYVDSSKVIGANTYKTSSAIVPSGLAKDDYVAIQWNFAESKTELTEIEKQSGTITAKKTNNIQINGEWIYEFATAKAVDDSYDYYVLNGVLVGATKTTAAAVENLVFVTGVTAGLSGTTARVWHTDGTGETLTVDTSNTVADAGNDGDSPVVPTADKFYTISETSKGWKFTARNTTADTMLNKYTYVDGGAVAGAPVATIGGVAIDDDAVIFVYNHSYDNGTAKTPLTNANYDVKVITGKQLKTLDAGAGGGANAATGVIFTTAAGYLTHKSNGLTKVGYGAVEYVSNHTTAASGNGPFVGWGIGTTGTNYAIVTSAAITISGGTQYSLWTGSESVTVTDKDTKINPAKFDLVIYESITDGAIKGAELKAIEHDVYTAGGETNFSPIAITGYEKTSNGYNLYANGEANSANAIKTTGDTKWIYIDSNASEAADIGLTSAVELSTARTVYSQNVQNAIVYCSTAKTADVVILDATGELNVDAATQVTLTITKTASGGGTLSVKNASGDEVASGAKLKAGDLLTLVSTIDTTTTVQAFSIATDTVLATAPAGTYTVVIADDQTAASITLN